MEETQMDNNVFFYPGSTPQRDPNQEYVNGVPQPPKQNLQPQSQPAPEVPDGIHKAVIRKVQTNTVEDMNNPGCSVVTIFFDLEFKVNGQPVIGTKVYNVTSEPARNSLRGELQILGYEVHDRTEFELIRGNLIGADVYVRVQAKEGKDADGKVTSWKSYTFVANDKGEMFTSVNPHIKW